MKICGVLTNTIRLGDAAIAWYWDSGVFAYPAYVAAAWALHNRIPNPFDTIERQLWEETDDVLFP